MKSKDVITALESDGWEKVGQKGSHVQLKHPTKKGRVTVPHAQKDITIGTLRSIEKQAQLRTQMTDDWEPIRLNNSGDTPMRHYIALIHKDEGSDYGVSFTDLRGVVSAGSTLNEDRTMAAEALAFHLEGLAADGEAVPEPTSLEEIMAKLENRNGVTVQIQAPAEEIKSVRLNITLPSDVLSQIDERARARLIHSIRISCSSCKKGDGDLTGVETSRALRNALWSRRSSLLEMW